MNAYPKVMKQMGYSTQDTNKSVGILKKGVDGLPTSLQDLTQSAQSFAILEKSATKGAQTATALNDAFLASGASAGDASRGVEQYSQMLASGTVDLQSWKTLQETMPYALTTVAKSFGLTGKSAERDLYAKLKSGKITVDELNKRFIALDGGVNGFANTARTATGGIGTSFTNMKNAVSKGLADTLSSIDTGLKKAGTGGIAAILNNVKVAITNTFTAVNSTIVAIMPSIIAAINTIAPVIKGIFSTVTTVISGIVNFVKANSGWLEPLAVGIATFAGAIVTINALGRAFTVLKVASAVGGDIKLLGFALNNMASSSKLAQAGLMLYNGVTKVAMGVQAAFNAVMAINPFVLIIAAVVALVAGITWWITQTKSGQAAWQAFITWLSGVWSGMVGFFQGIWAGISAGVSATVTFFQTTWQGFITFFQGIWAGVAPYFSAAWQALVVIVQGIVTTLSGVWQGYVTAATAIWNGMVSVATGIWNLLKAVVLGPILVLIDLLTGNWSKMKSDATLIWNSIKGALGQIVGGIVTAVTGYFRGMGQAVGSIWNGIKAAASAVWGGIKSVISTLVTGVVNIAKTVWNGGKAAISAIWNGIRAAASAVWGGIKSTISSLANGAINGVRSAWNGAVSFASGIWNGVKSAVQGAMHFDLLGAGRAIMNSFLSGLKSAWGAVKSFVGGIGNWIRDHKGPISYDRRLLIPAGKAIMEGFGGSLNNNFEYVKRSVSSYAGQIADQFGHQEYEANAKLTASSVGVAGQINGGLNALSDEVAEQSAQAPTFYVHNELVGDKITTTVNSQNSRRQNINNLIMGGGI
ncbi:phage tail protein [Periweissella fabalis]|uniref:Tape measure protein n=2 Tax=Periweissella TaxID=2930384 RepID=A0A7X6S1Z3_9LACO|nr:tape measure protein [Periweissella fabalis]MCM0599230.1 tape measure protein [Periweissella fabalis]NKZ23509.1 tape measure protein [Periweissella fabalis]